jgi:eukaryotic-like serine/threonine-protein kinase
MDVKLRCPNCFIKIRASEEHKGTKVNCPRCERAIKIPSPKCGIGLNVGGFIIEQWLGNGAMGEVHLATQTSMNRQVALKILPNECIEDDEDQHRFIREVKTLAKLNHPNIVAAISAGEFDGGSYLAMNYISGVTIEDEIIQNGPMSEKEAIRCCNILADALDYAWENNRLLHRDLKPANFMLDQKGNVHLMDMGIAKSMDSDFDLTVDGMVMGTPYYMSPEQACGEKNLDMRSDIYSLGASLYHMVTGTPPYDKGTSMQVMAKKLIEPPIAPEMINENLSPRISTLIQKLMRIKLDERPKDWQAVIKLFNDMNSPNVKKISVNANAIPKINAQKKKSSTPAIITGMAIVVIALIILFLVK